MESNRAFVAAFAAALYAVLIPPGRAQERQPLHGRVLAGDGTPAGKARVTICIRPIVPGHPPEVRIATTDEQGRFTATVAAGHGASLWARDADGRFASGVIDEAIPGQPQELRLQHATRSRQVVLFGSAMWDDLGPLRIETSPRAANPVWTPTDAHGRAPRGPASLDVRIVDRLGEVLLWVPAPTGDRIEVTMPEPAFLHLRLVDERGTPIPDGEVFHEVPNTGAARGLFGHQPTGWRRAAATDADGVARPVVPKATIPGQPALPRLLLRAPGRGETIVQFDSDKHARVGHATVELDAPATLTVPMAPDARLVLRERGRPVGIVRGELGAAPCGGFAVTRWQELLADTNGTCAITLPIDPVESMLCLQTEADGPTIHARIPPWTPGSQLVFDLGQTRAHEFLLSDDLGNPIAGMPGVIVPIGTRFATELAVPVWCDRAGRLRVRVGADSWVLLFCDGKRYARIEIPSIKDRQQAPASAAIVCRPLPCTSILVRDVAGHPVGGVHLSSGQIPRTMSAQMLYDATTLAEELGMTFNTRVLESGQASSDANGRIELGLLPIRATPYVTLSSAGSTAQVGLTLDAETVVTLRSR